jgi:hypothetical protein
MLMPVVTNTLVRKLIDKKNENCPLVLSTAGCLTCLKIEKVRTGNLTEKCMDAREGDRLLCDCVEIAPICMEAPAAAGFRFVLIRTSSVGNCI